jgi:uncharacterized protein YjbI with pentapeptide repeats
MANQEQVELLKQGVDGWNKWRQEKTDVKIDLSRADLREANLWRAHLRKANLALADLSKADLRVANLRGANLRGANLRGAILNGSGLRDADLKGADLKDVNLVGADLSEADLGEANLIGAVLKRTLLGELDLCDTKGLDEVIHVGPSPISTSTLERSNGKIPEKFLRGCGLSDWEIESAKLYQPRLSTQEIDNILYRVHDLRANQAIQINPLFISYNHEDGEFIDAIEKQLIEKGIRFWRDIHDAPAGRLEKIVDRAIRQNPIVLLILSKNSVNSDWVEHEARTARELEKELGRDVLCPVALDDMWKDCAWPIRLREQIMEYNILDFSKWEDEQEFGKMFRKLVDGLDLFYKEPGERVSHGR